MAYGTSDARLRVYCRAHQAAWQRALRYSRTAPSPPQGVTRLVIDGRAVTRWQGTGKPEITPLRYPAHSAMLVRYFLAAGYTVVARDKKRVVLEKDERGVT